LIWYHYLIPNTTKRKLAATLAQIFTRPVSGSIKWLDIEAMFASLGAEISEREGSRVGVYLFGEVRVFHRPHPTPDMDKCAVASICKWLDSHGVRP
jgi:HicA toxin of bacterial toxin-antitoxin,